MWVRFDDTFPDHPKVAALTPAAFRAFVESVCYCSRHRTDGQLRPGVVRAALRVDSTVIAELVDAGLWDATDAGWAVHDYLRYQLSKADYDRQAATARDRRRTWTGRRPDDVAPTSGDRSLNVARTSVARSPNVGPTSVERTGDVAQTSATTVHVQVQGEIDQYHPSTVEGATIWRRLVDALDVGAGHRREFFDPCTVVAYDPATKRLTLDAGHPTRRQFLREHFTEAIGDAARAIDPDLRIAVVLAPRRLVVSS